MKKPGYVVATERDVTVALDTTLTDELIAEGFAREIISKVQTMRKEAGFEVTDRITVGVATGDETLKAAIRAYDETIRRGVLALSVETETLADGVVKQWNINGVDAELSIRKA